MIDFLCKLWPYLAGGLIGWLAAGWFARRLKHAAPPVERVVEKLVEKQVDNPQHLSLISKLENENKEISGLRTKLSGYESATPKTIDNPAHLKKISELEAQVYNFKNSSGKTVEVTKTVDNPVHLKRIDELEAQVNALKSSTKGTSQTAVSRTSKTIDNPVHLKRISELESQVNTLQKGPEIDLVAAKAAGFKLATADDLTAIEGIGPKINDLIKADGIKSFSALSNTPVSSIQTILDKAGPKYTIANPGTWPDQANLAANNRWPALRALQDVLIGGVYPGTSSSGSSSASSSKSGESSSAKQATANKKPSTPKAVKSVEVDKAAAKAAGFRVKSREGRDDFTIVEGIGPKINDLIHDAGIHRYAELGKTKVEVIQKILEAAGPRYALAKPGTWPAQADMAAANKWEALKAWQDELDGGK